MKRSTTAAARWISRSSTSRLRTTSGVWFGMRSRRKATRTAMACRGFFTSWATSEVIWPRAASWAEYWMRDWKVRADTATARTSRTTRMAPAHPAPSPNTGNTEASTSRGLPSVTISTRAFRGQDLDQWSTLGVLGGGTEQRLDRAVGEEHETVRFGEEDAVL